MNTTKYDSDTVKRYLLQDLDLDKQKELEVQLLSTDSDFEEQLDSIEDELIDEFALGQLSPEDEERVRHSFVWSPSRTDKLRLANALGNHHAWSARREARQPVPRMRALVDQLSWLWKWQPAPALSYALATLLVIATVAVAWLFATNTRLQEELIVAQSGGAETAAASAVIVTVWLEPGALTRGMGEVERLIVPEDSTLVRMQLDLGIDDYESYRVALSDESGDEIWSQSKLPASILEEKAVVTLTVPAGLLRPGDYSIRLSGLSIAGDYELVGRYRFRALHR